MHEICFLLYIFMTQASSSRRYRLRLPQGIKPAIYTHIQILNDICNTIPIATIDKKRQMDPPPNPRTGHVVPFSTPPSPSRQLIVHTHTYRNYHTIGRTACARPHPASCSARDSLRAPSTCALFAPWCRRFRHLRRVLAVNGSLRVHMALFYVLGRGAGG